MDLMKKGILFYVSYNSYSGTKYYTPSDEELKKVLETTDEILLIPIAFFNRYTDKNGNEYRVISKEIIDNMTADMVGDPNRLETIRGEYHAAANVKVAADYHIQDYIDDAYALAKRLVAINPNVKLWFSVPLAEGFHALTHLFATAWEDTIDAIKATVSDEIWENNVKGIYFSQEDVITSGYTKFDYDQPENDFNNPIVKAMRAVSNKAHSYGKNVLWIPYYHEAAPSSTNLGYVVNLTNIFDTVIIQPSFFFNPARVDEIGIIADSIRQQAVVDINRKVIGGKKTSNTVIGFEMEIDSQFFDREGYPERYYAYENGFGEFVGTYPTAYYSGAPETMLKLTDLISKFLNKNG